MINGGPISWKSRRQDSVALSMSESEYMTPSEVGKEILYLRTILRDVGHTQTVPTNFCRELYFCWCHASDSSSDTPHGCRCTH